jgi:hypothetical protein
MEILKPDSDGDIEFCIDGCSNFISKDEAKELIEFLKEHIDEY